MAIDFEAVYSARAATDHRMEVSRLTCKECGGLQEGCTCEVSESDNENGPPCKHCGHPCLSHDDEWGSCQHLGRTDTLHEVCQCPGYEEPDETV